MVEDDQYLRLSDIVRMTGREPGELIGILPSPSIVSVDRDAVCIWSRSEVDALATELAKQDIDRLKRERNQLRIEINRARADLRLIRPIRDRVHASLKQRSTAYWPWESPMQSPKRVQGVYRLIQEGQTVYIGQSGNIMSRVATHAAQKDFDEFSYAIVDGDKETLNEIESALIILERPPWNHGLDGRLRHPTGHHWTREEAEAVLDKYRPRAGTPDKEVA